jgi:WD40 repeat protein/tRNA A-37 threonylcarbamoyl transferase component Bud32
MQPNDSDKTAEFTPRSNSPPIDSTHTAVSPPDGEASADPSPKADSLFAATRDGTLPQSGEAAKRAQRLSDADNIAGLTIDKLPDLPGYSVEAVLGRGGMGVVYRARNLKLNRAAAIKMILAGTYQDSTARMRFLMEAEAVAQLDHPNIIQVHEFGTHDDLPYFALEYVGGGTLTDKLEREGKLAPTAAAELVAKLAEGIAAAHARGIVHRDLKPANILLTESGEPKVADFGLARIGASELTGTGAVMGTPSYMSPEQAAGRTREVGTASDVYGLGAILYELLTGRPPFRSDSVMGTIQQVMTRQPDRPRSIGAAIPRDLETICLKCLEKEPKKRYPTADALAADLRAFLEGRSIAARPVGSLGALWRWRKRNPVLAGALAAAAIALVLGSILSTGFGLWAMDRAEAARMAKTYADQAADDARTEKTAANAAREVAEEQKRVAQASEQAAEAARKEALDTLYATRINLAHREWLHGLSYSARDFLAQAPQDRRGWEYYFLRGLFSPERHILRPGGLPAFIAGSADGSLIASSSQENDLRLWDAVSGLELARMPFKGPPQLLQFALHGHNLVCAAKQDIHLVDAGTRRVVWTCEGLRSPVVALNWSADERRITAVTQDGSVRRIDAATGQAGPPSSFQLKLDRLTIQLLGIGLHPAISLNGRYLAALYDDDDSVRVWDLSNGKLVFNAQDHERFIGQFDFSPDGKLLATPGGEGTIVIREVPSGRIVHRLRGHKSWVWGASFSPDGRFLASGSKDTTARLWDATTGETIQVYHGHQSEVWGVAFVGQALLSRSPDASMRIWDASDPVLYAAHALESARKKGLPLPGHSDETDGMVLLHHGTRASDVVFSPDGRRIATSAYQDNSAPFHVIVRDLVSHQETCRIATPAASERTLAFSQDGKYLAVLLHGNPGKESTPDLRVYDSATGILAWHVAGPPSKDARLGVQPGSGQFEALYPVGKTTSLVRYEVDTGRQTHEVKLASAVLRAFHLDGNRLCGHSGSADSNNHSLMEFDPESGAVLRSWSTGRPNLTAMAASGRLLATAFTQGGPAQIDLWEAETGRRLHTLEGAIGVVLGLAFSPDGRRLLSCGSDFTARVWDVDSGRELLTLSNHGDVVFRSAWSRDGSRIATSCQDALVRVWSATGSGTLPAVDSWPLLSPPAGTPLEPSAFLNIFKGDWRVDGDALVGTLREWPGLNFSIAQTMIRTIDLPRSADIQFEATVSNPMLVAVCLSNPARSLTYAPFVSGVQMPFGPGTRLLVQNQKAAQQFSLQGNNRPFALEANRPYQFRILREDSRLLLSVDGRELLDEKIPEIDLPELNLQGSWSSPGDEIRFRRLTVRAPGNAVRERHLRARLDRLVAEELLPEAVRERLNADASLSEGERRTLLAELATMPLDIAALRTSGRTLATKDGATPAELSRARRQLRAVVEMSGGRIAQPREENVGDFGLLSLVEHRLGNAEAAAEILFPLLTRVQSFQGYNTPEELAFAALVEEARGRRDSARGFLQRLRDIERPEGKWENASQPTLKEARELAERLVPRDAAREQMIEAILAIEDSGWVKKDLQAYFGGRTPDCIEVDQRGEQPGPFDLKLTLAAQRERRALQFQEALPEGIRVIRDNWDIRITGDAATASFATITVIPKGWTGRWFTTYHMKRMDGAWKIVGSKTRQTHLTEDKQLVEMNAAYWAKKDQAVDDAPNAFKKLEALTEARRYREAFESGRKVVEELNPSPEDWFNYAKAAMNLGEASEAVRAARKAHELAPEMIPLPPWAK